MQREQPCLSEHSPCATSSKNAKDKSNSSTLLAIRNTKDTGAFSGRGSRCSSEKDSGYSDGSDWQQTDVVDKWSNRSQSRGGESAGTSQPGQNQQRGQENPGNPTHMSAGRDLLPIYVIKNMVLQQPDGIKNKGQLAQRSGSRDTGSSGAAYMILLQQPSLLQTPTQTHKPPCRKSSATGKKMNGTYLPILNSYPRIAPHPSKKPPDKSATNDESQNLSKRVCTEHKSDDTSVARGLAEQQTAALTSGLPRSPSSMLLSRNSPSSTTVSSSQGSRTNRGPHRNGSASSQNRRFLNTVQILRQSGLLDITVRTKELLRQSNSTERDIAQLRQHTELLCQVASNPGCSLNGITVLEHLQQSMAESGSYPDLKMLKNAQILCQPDSACQPESISTGDTESLPSHLHSTVPDSNQNLPVPQQSHSGRGRELEDGRKPSEKVTFVPPDSSTG